MLSRESIDQDRAAREGLEPIAERTTEHLPPTAA